jgi:hypothetical protein
MLVGDVRRARTRAEPGCSPTGAAWSRGVVIGCGLSAVGAAVDLTLADLTLETFFPADEETAAVLQEYAAKHK